MKTSTLFSKLLISVTMFLLFLGISGTGYCTDPTPDCPENLLFLLRFDEAVGPNYADFKGLHNAVASNSPSATVGKINGAQLFTDNTKVNIPDNGTDFDWASGSSFSFECWLKTSVTKGQVALSRYSTVNPEHSAAWWIGLNENGNPIMEIKDNWDHNSVLYDTTRNIADGQWHYLVGVRNGVSDYERVYLDGVQILNRSAGLSNDFICELPTDITVGYMLRAYESDPEYHFNGSLDEVAVYTRALTNAEVAANYNAGVPKKHCNYAPMVTSTAITTATEDLAYSYNFVVTDLDASDVLSLSAVSKPSWLNFTWTPGQKTAVLSGTPTNDNVGSSNNVTLRVNDGFTSTDQSFAITVANVNDVPVITGQSVLSVDEDSPITLEISDLTITDVDNAPAALSIQVLAGTHYTFVGNVVTPALNYNGELSVSVVAKDLLGQSAEYPVIVTVNPINDPPVITSTPASSVNVNSPYIYNMTVNDPDEGDVLTLTAPNIPDWLTFTVASNSGILMGVPLTADIGSYAIILKANDGHVDVMQGFGLEVTGSDAIDIVDNDIVKQAYPNPAFNSISFKLLQTGAAKIEILDITGKLQKVTNTENEQVIEINISDMSNGFYIYKVYQNGKVGIGNFSKN
jgi:hypothetical protein